MIKRCLITVVAAVLIALSVSVYAADKGLTEETGQELLKELRQLRGILEKLQKPQAPPSPPTPEGIKIKGGGDYTMGKSDAPLTLIEYTDYQCPFCSRFESTTFTEIKKNFIDTGKVRFIQRDMPLEFHKYSLKAAQATRCAGEQGKYWEMKDTLFRNQQKLEISDIEGYAKGLSLNAGKFKGCLESDKYIAEINEEAKYANSMGITGTPSFVVGKVKGNMVEGVKITGAQPYVSFEAAINEMLGSGQKGR